MEKEDMNDADESSTSIDEEMDIDTVLEKLGCGMVQCIIIITGLFMEFSFSYQTLIMVFMGINPPWKCALKSSNSFCKRNFNKSFDVTDSDYNKRCKLNRNDWVYTVHKGYSIVTEYDLVCSQEYIVALVNASFFIGWGIGGLFTGFLSDKFGRKFCIISGYVALSIFAITSSYITAVWQLAILRVLIGVCVGTLVACLITLVAEYTAPIYRSVTMVTIQISFAISIIILSLMAMYIRAWRKLELYAAFPGLLAMVIAFFIPESARWLTVNGNPEEAEKILKKFVAINRGVSFNFTLKRNEDTYIHEHHSYTYVDLFRGCSLIKFTMAQIFGWLSVGMIYYGTTLEASNLGGNIYENLMYSMIGDIVGTFLTVFACNLLGKRYAISISLGFCGVFLVCVAASQGSVARIVFAFIAKVFICIAFVGFYIWSTELFPTVLRNQGMIFCQLGNRIGSASAPFLTTLLKDVFTPLPFIIMAIFSILACLSSLTLPETNWKPTREKYDDMFVEKDVSPQRDSSEIMPLMSQ